MKGYGFLLALAISVSFASADCLGNGTCVGCDRGVNSSLVLDACGVCGGSNDTCTCSEYLGYSLTDLDYALLRWAVGASMVKINDTLDTLYSIQQALPLYHYQAHSVSLGGYIDILHTFCDNCLDEFDYAQVWFADWIAGNCAQSDCQPLDLQTYQLEWSMK